MEKSKSDATKARLEELKAKMKMRKNPSAATEDPKEPEEEIIVKFDFVATGS